MKTGEQETWSNRIEAIYERSPKKGEEPKVFFHQFEIPHVFTTVYLSFLHVKTTFFLVSLIVSIKTKNWHKLFKSHLYIYLQQIKCSCSLIIYWKETEKSILYRHMILLMILIMDVWPWKVQYPKPIQFIVRIYSDDFDFLIYWRWND